VQNANLGIVNSAFKKDASRTEDTIGIPALVNSKTGVVEREDSLGIDVIVAFQQEGQKTPTMVSGHLDHINPLDADKPEQPIKALGAQEVAKEVVKLAKRLLDPERTVLSSDKAAKLAQEIQDFGQKISARADA
jgi:hypothetical protein